MKFLPLLLLLAGLAGPALAFDVDSRAPVNLDTRGVGIRGYDPVAYFTDGRPMLGKAEFSAQHQGATYRFASAEHLAAFQAQPERYAPQFGGFCAMAVSLQRKFDGDPDAWTIADGRLYLNVTPATRKRWLEDVKGNVSRAEGHWPDIRDKAPRSLGGAS